MADSKEQLKRKNYFDLKRDEFMAMDEYLQSPISEIDLKKMKVGGVMDIDTMTQPVGLLDDVADLRILSMKLVLKEAADSLKEMDRIDKLSPDEIIIEFENLIGKEGA